MLHRSGERQIDGLGASLLEDRKSTRLNSSHGYISYAVICLKNKFNTAFGKEQWGEVARFVHAHEKPDDVIVIHTGFVMSAFTYYYGTESGQRVKPSNNVRTA